MDTFDFEALYATFFPRIVRYLTRLVGPEGAEDLAQEVFIKISRSLGEKLWKKTGDTPAFDRGREGFRDQPGVSPVSSTASEFRGESSLSTWVYRIATNAALDQLRSAEHRSSVSAVSPCGDEDAAVPDLGISAEQQVIRGEMSECVRSLVDELPESYRTVLVLSEVESLRDAEIAEVLDLTLETVKIRLHRARARLRKRMEERCSLYRDRESTLLCDIKAPPAGR